MNPRFARLRPEMQIDQAIAYLRRQAGQVETIYYAYVLDTDQRLLGTVSLRDLLSARRDQNVSQVMRRHFQSVLENERQEAVAKLMSDHRLLAIPVLDKSRVMQGIVTVDDAMQAARENADEQLQKVGGMQALEGAYLDNVLWAFDPCSTLLERVGLVLWLGGCGRDEFLTGGGRCLR